MYATHITNLYTCCLTRANQQFSVLDFTDILLVEKLPADQLNYCRHCLQLAKAVNVTRKTDCCRKTRKSLLIDCKAWPLFSFITYLKNPPSLVWYKMNKNFYIRNTILYTAIIIQLNWYCNKKYNSSNHCVQEKDEILNKTQKHVILRMVLLWLHLYNMLPLPL